jgi:predicted nucleotidyltransferase component of viral defense system
MKDYLKDLVAEPRNALLKHSVAREYLQARILGVLQEHGAFLNWVFHGGTALRFLFRIPRYSEDLDFAVLDPAQPHHFGRLVEKIRAAFEAEGYRVTVKSSPDKTVAACFVRFAGLPHELGLSPHRDQALAVKLELDTNPPAGAGVATTLIRRYVTLNLLHHDKASLLAGKINAVLCRKYVKGRDLFDLVWYLADPSWPEPNLRLLNAGLEQMRWKGPTLDDRNWRAVLRARIESVRWEEALNDVRPFLERAADLSPLTREGCLSLLNSKAGAGGEA